MVGCVPLVSVQAIGWNYNAKHRERYRDLLQASASIISIAQSSKRVEDALEEMKSSMPNVDGLQLPRRTSATGKDGAFAVRFHPASCTDSDYADRCTSQTDAVTGCSYEVVVGYPGASMAFD